MSNNGKKADGTLAKLKANDYVGLIPGGICQNSIRNLRIFIFGTQISPEHTNRYTVETRSCESEGTDCFFLKSEFFSGVR